MNKKLSIIFIFLLSFTALNTFAQSYSFSTFKASYAKLPQDKKDILTNTEKAWGTEFGAGVTRDYPIRMLGHSNNEIRINAQDIGLDQKQGDTTSPNLYPFYHTGNSFVDRNYDPTKSWEELGPSISQVSYIPSGEPGNRLFKVEYDNVKFERSGVNDSIFFQVWFYEGTDIIEIHYGPSNVSTPKEVLVQNINEAGYIIGFYDFLIPGPNTALETLYLKGAPANPQLIYNDHYVDNIFLDSYPTNGTVYRFTPTTVGIDTRNSEVSFKAWPNPAHGNLCLTINEVAIIRFTSLTGQLVVEQQAAAGENTLDISGLNPGMYLLQVQTNQGISSSKIVVN